MERASLWCSNRQSPAARPIPFEHAAKLSFEGTLSKNAATPYRSNRNEGRLKIKKAMKPKFPVIGFVEDPMLGARRGWP
jgi:ATP-dependent DNA ligase